MKLLSASRVEDGLCILMEAQEKSHSGEYIIALSVLNGAHFPPWAPVHQFSCWRDMKPGEQVQFDGRRPEDEGSREFRRDGEEVYLRRFFRCPFDKRYCEEARFVLLIDGKTHELIDKIPIA